MAYVGDTTTTFWEIKKKSIKIAQKGKKWAHFYVQFWDHTLTGMILLLKNILATCLFSLHSILNVILYILCYTLHVYVCTCFTTFFTHFSFLPTHTYYIHTLATHTTL